MGRRDGRHGRRRLLRWLAVALVLALLAGGAAAYRFDLVDRLDLVERWRGGPATPPDPATVAPPAGLSLPEIAGPRTVASPAPLATGRLDPRKVRRALAAGLADDALGPRVHVAVADLAGGETLLQRGPARGFIPASTMKLVTAAAALEVLGSDHTFTTRVVQGARPRQIVLIGGGDPLLAGSTPTPEQAASQYPPRADVETLAREVALALAAQGRTRVRVGYDASLFTGPDENPFWREDYVPEGIVARVGALWVDGGRQEGRPGRVVDPPRFAAERFAAALAEAGIVVDGAPREARTPAAAVELAAVESAPLGQIVQRILDVSDNEAAEVVLHHVGIAVRGEGSFAAGAAAIVATLRGLGVAMERDLVRDGSGLSRENRLTSQTLIEVLRLGASAQHPGLRETLTGLPVAGFTGSLTSRFDTGSDAGLGLVRAKTGTLTGVHGLAGTAIDRDGNTMAFVLLADRVAVPDTLAARRTLDELAAALADCACSRTD